MNFEARMALYPGNIVELSEFYSKGFVLEPSDDPFVINLRLRINEPSGGYSVFMSKDCSLEDDLLNTAISVEGPNLEKVIEIMGDLEKKLPVKLYHLSEEMNNHLKHLAYLDYVHNIAENN
ncbi:hypothetical protein KY348_02500 [Candidatus Woesearchaeota archaeon]|nr:hypothetical protein [Candidatus Woesearchaeota archaeon]